MIATPKYFITGDTHGDFLRVEYFVREFCEGIDDVLVILGDAGINYHGGDNDRNLKKTLAELPLTLFCVHGNHEIRPETLVEYQEIPWRGGMAYVEPEFPNLIFAKDGEIYDFNGQRFLAIGGAHSIDKQIRLARDWRWFADEQPSEAIRKRVEDRLEVETWRMDVVLSHTCPMKYLPSDLWGYKKLPPVFDIDHSTEEWLDSIEKRLDYRQWFCGHFHIDRQAGRFHFVHKKFYQLSWNES